MLKRWLHLTGFIKCPCPTCKRGRGEALDDEDIAYDGKL